ncbi:MAG: threonine synthase [Sphingobacteriales bacterium]|nr:threonine synthase [Sphingobacteriales bacterium]
MVLYYSTNRQSRKVSFREAVLEGLAPDKGLYMPDIIVPLSEAVISGFSDMNYHEIAFHVLKNYASGIDEKSLQQMTEDAYRFEVPLENVYNNLYVMRLDQGPSASFKDFGALMLARFISYFLRQSNEKMTILTATSGDTGGAIASAFYKMENIDVVVLFPDNEITNRQRRQMTTLGENVTAIAVKGNFDDCQALVKKAFADESLKDLRLSSANSINIGRLLPQSVYYFYAHSRLREKSDDGRIIFSVPSGNFGNMMGGMIAKGMGLPASKFVIATNSNDVFPVFIQTSDYRIISPSRKCISTAMNVGHPSNMARLFDFYSGMMDHQANVSVLPSLIQMKKDIYTLSVNDEQTRKTIVEAWEKHHLLLEPHGAVGWAGLLDFLQKHPENENKLCVSVETAHPAKFPEEIVSLLGFEPELPESLSALDQKEEHYIRLDNNYGHFSEFLKSR